MFKRPCNSAPPQFRLSRGVATLELVLVLPLLLFIMALFINAGTSAAWKVRAQGAARDAIWRVRWPRTSDKPLPGGWPETASLSTDGLEPLAILDDPAIDKKVARGPQIGNVDVNQQLLDPTRGGRTGEAAIDRARPLLAALGDMHYDVDHPLIDDTWTYLQTGLSGNQQRRIKVIYDLHETELGDYQGYVKAVDAVQGAVMSTNVLPLTYRLSAWNGQQRFQDPDFPRFDATSPDFHPQLGSFCSLDAGAVYENQVQSLIERITDDKEQSGDPSLMRTMAGGYIGLYKKAIADMENLLQQLENADPPAPPATIAAVAAELAARKAELEPKIAELEAFMQLF